MTPNIQRPTNGKIIEVKPKTQQIQPKERCKPPRPTYEQVLSQMAITYDLALVEARKLAEKHFDSPTKEDIKQLGATLMIQATKGGALPEVRDGIGSTDFKSEVPHE